MWDEAKAKEKADTTRFNDEAMERARAEAKTKERVRDKTNAVNRAVA